MYFSAKITNSVLNFLDKQGLDQEGLYELTDLPLEFLRDPSSWLDAHKVEAFLRIMEMKCGAYFDDTGIYQKIGSQSFELRSWGVLDSVLRMMQNPEYIYSQPQRFISYFVNPAPPIGDIESHTDGLSFELPISNQEFPLVTEYLGAAMEALPRYVGREPVQVKWEQTRISIYWGTKQAPLLAETDLEPNPKPELIENMVRSLENLQLKADQQSQLLKQKEQEIYQLKAELEFLLQSPDNVDALADKNGIYIKNQNIPPIEELKNDILRFNDYYTRATQLIVLLIGQGRNNVQVKRAMKKVDWEHIQTLAPELMSQVISRICRLQTCLSGLGPAIQKNSVSKVSSVESESTQLEL